MIPLELSVCKCNFFNKSDNFLLNWTWHRFFVVAVWRWPESYSSCGVGIGKQENISLTVEKNNTFNFGSEINTPKLFWVEGGARCQKELQRSQISQLKWWVFKKCFSFVCYLIFFNF